MEEGQSTVTRVDYVDWRNRNANNGKHGGKLAVSFVLVVEIIENLAFLANASNLVTYLAGHMNFPISMAATSVTNYMGTAFFLALLGGFLSDAFFTTYCVFLISALLELLGLVILTVQARSSSLKPPPCNNSLDATTQCQMLSGGKAAMFFTGLYVVALGVGGIKGALPAHGAEQFDEHTVQGRKNRSTFFNYYVFCLACGGLIAVTLVVWVEDNKGWQWGFGIATIAIFLSIIIFIAGSNTYRNKIPTESPITTIAKVIAAAMLNGKSRSNIVVDDKVESKEQAIKIQENDGVEEITSSEKPSNELKFLNKAVEGKASYSALSCTIEEVENVKIVIKLMPIFLSTIMLNTSLAQLSTFSVQQASTMNTRIGKLKVPPASLPIFPIMCIIILAPIYDHIIIPFARKVTKTETGIKHLQRIGLGLLLSVIAMLVAALVEVKRKNVARNNGLIDSHEPLPISFFWIAFQYLFLGSADLFTLAGMLEFFFTETHPKMRSLATALSWASLALGYYQSSALVSAINGITGRGNNKAWLQGTNLNHYQLEKFYWLMCALNALNFLAYLFWASRYKYAMKGSGSRQVGNQINSNSFRQNILTSET